MVSKLQLAQICPTLQCGRTDSHHKWGGYWLEAHEALRRPRYQVFRFNQAFSHSLGRLWFAANRLPMVL